MKQKMTKDIIPQDFSLGLACVDAIPVIFFGLTFCTIGLRTNPFLFIGALICLISGALKVLWKVIVVLQKKNIWPLFLQMRIAMPLGFLIMMIGFILQIPQIDFAVLLKALLTLPAAIFFFLGILGMIGMCVFASILDSSDAKSNWIEQLTNGIAQICFFICALIL